MILKAIKKRGIKGTQTIHDAHMVCPWHRLYRFQDQKQCTKCAEGSFANVIRFNCIRGNLGKSIIGFLEAELYHSLNYYDKYIDAYISPSYWLAELISKKVNNDIRVIRNFVKINLEENKTKTIDKNYLLYFGRISTEKGIVQLTHKLKHSKIELKIVGSGPDENQLITTDYIKYLGPKYGQELIDIIRKAKFTIQPSQWFENSPMTIYESFALGVPVIGSRHSGFLELIKNNYTGLLFDFDSDTIIKDIENALNEDIDLANNCTKTFEIELSKEVNYPKVVALYQELLNK